MNTAARVLVVEVFVIAITIDAYVFDRNDMVCLTTERAGRGIYQRQQTRLFCARFRE